MTIARSQRIASFPFRGRTDPLTTMGPPTHAAFSDESRWNTGRYRSISLLTMRLGDQDALEQSLRNCMAGCAVAELKWTGRWSHSKTDAARATLDALASAAQGRRLRIDVLTWDIEDTRHDVEGRDDLLNLAVMYYHLYRNVFRSRWDSTAAWRLSPDRHGGLDWHELEEILGTGAPTSASCFAGNLAQLPQYRVVDVRPVVALHNRLTQACDLLAGLAAFSWQESERYQHWRLCKTPTLFPATVDVKYTKRDESRFRLIHHLRNKWKRWLQAGTGGLRTMDPALPVNFWLYRPQHSRDKAPARGRQGRITRARDMEAATRPR